MKALVITRFGGPEVLELQQVPDAHPTPEQRLVKVEAGGLNFADLMTTHGGYAGTPKPPLTARQISWLPLADVDLGIVAPIQLHEIGPGGDAIMTAESEAHIFLAMTVETGPAADAGIGAVGTDDPARGHEAIREKNAFTLKT